MNKKTINKDKKFYLIKNKNCKGITLIALVITIIVLLILVAVSIATLTGNNGIINNAGKAKEKTEISAEKETIVLAAIAAISKEKGEILTEENLQEQLNKLIGEEKTQVSDRTEDFEVWFKESNRFYEVDKNGKVGEVLKKEEDIYSGDFTKDKNGNMLDGTEENAYQFNCIEDLVMFYKELSGVDAWKYNDKYYKLMKNLNFKSMSSYQDFTTTEFGDINKNGTVEILFEELTTGTGFPMITRFLGTVNGQGYELRNLYINKEGNAGLFETLQGTILNLGIIGNIEGTADVGGIVAAVEYSSQTKIENCYFNGRIKSGHYGGGICGYAYSTNFIIDRCYNLGEIIAEEEAGGIAGRAIGNTVLNSYNKGKIYGKGYAGGIIGFSSAVDGNTKVYNTVNYGNVKSDSMAGGIVAYLWRTIEIKNSFNTGDIEGVSDDKFGAIIGNASGDIAIMDNVFYLEGTAKKGTNVCADTAIVYKEDIIKSEDFVKKLNDYIINNQEATSGWIKWKVVKDGYPIFE